jgi:hypothetical protein
MQDVFVLLGTLLIALLCVIMGLWIVDIVRGMWKSW